MVEHLSDYMYRVKGYLKLISKHASTVTTQVELVLKAQDDLLNELNNKNKYNDVRVMTRGGKMTVGVKTGGSRVGGPELCV